MIYFTPNSADNMGEFNPKMTRTFAVIDNEIVAQPLFPLTTSTWEVFWLPTVS